MTQIDFHTDIPDKLHYTCRLIRKARQKDVKIVVYHDDANALQELDQALWTFSEADFLPHVMAHDPLAAQTPILLTNTEPGGQLPHHDLLLNLSLHAPEAFTRFNRMIEVVADNDGERLAARARYASYKQQAHPLTHISLKK
jgi:DNA polymerase III subunit chi